jgi:thiamine kinase-like enzyme
VISGLDQLLEATRQPGLRELRAAVAELLDEPRVEGRVVGEQRLDDSGSINRVRLELDGARISIVVKRSRPAPAHRNRLIARRCLPAVGLETGAPAILATAAERSGRHVWQVYEDLGERTLETDRDAAAVEAAVQLLGKIHSRFIDHPLLAEMRDCGADFGPGFYSSNVRDAVRCLEALSPPQVNGFGDWSALRERLLERLWALRAGERERGEAIVELGGPETLLHGDMWHKNASVTRERGRVRVRMIDWDHAGLGPTGYDLSTFLSGFPADERSGVLALYGEVVADSGWRLPSSAELADLFQTFELARVANCVVWSALAATDGVEGALEELQENEAWLASLDEVLLG